MVLIIVDFQNDFCSEKGALFVPWSINALYNVEYLLDSGRVSKVIFTIDWHPVNHCSFKDNGGEWPTHCVQYSQGAAINEFLLKACRENNIPYTVVRKGENKDKEEYGAFQDILVSEEDVAICGIAGDFCVLETLKNIMYLRPKVFLQGVASIDGGIKINKFIKDNELDIISTDLHSNFCNRLLYS